MGAAIKEMKRRGLPFYISTKSNKADAGDLRKDLETSLSRLNVDSIDFYHCWCLLTLDAWEKRKSGGAVKEIQKALDEGLISHPVFSTHLPGNEIRSVIEEGYFEGVTLGYCAINFLYREEGVNAAAENGLGVVVMNPLGGGLLTGHPEQFSFIRSYPEQSNLEAALHFILANEKISAALVGFRNKADVDSAAAAIEAFTGPASVDLESVKSRVKDEYNSLCTTCGYCRDCPVEIPVWKFMETANLIELGEKNAVPGRLKYHWGVDIKDLEKCTECRHCIEVCTQHLPILERFEKLKQVVAEVGKK
jgi:hypothetical protein